MYLDIIMSPALVNAQKRTYDIYVVIDVFRATTAFCTALHYGIKEIVPFADLEEARKMKDKGFLIAGERNGEKLNGFDFGNSPFEFMKDSIKGKSLAFTTTNGTHCIETVKRKGKVIIASFNNISSIISYILTQKQNVAIVCSGWKGMPNIEDTICAGAIANELLKNKYEAVEDSVFICKNIYLESLDNQLYYIVENSSRISKRMSLLEDDFKKCLEKDIYNVCPILIEDRIISYM